MQSIVGPPLRGSTDLVAPPGKNTVGQDTKGSEEEKSFGKTLDSRMSSKNDQAKTSKDERAETKESSNERAKVEKPITGKVMKKVSASREKAIQEFMDSFESEFKISPTRIVEAMAQLSDVELTSEPEVTAEAVIAQLGLDDGESQKAQAMYSSLLQQLQTPGFQSAKIEEAETRNLGFASDLVNARLESAHGRSIAKEQSVDVLTQNFWQQNVKGNPEALPLNEGRILEELKLALPGNMKTLSLEDLPPHLQGQMKEASLSPELLKALVTKLEAAPSKQSLNEGFETSSVDDGIDFKAEPDFAPQAEMDQDSLNSAMMSTDDFSGFNQEMGQQEGQMASMPATEGSEHENTVHSEKPRFKTTLQKHDVDLSNALHGLDRSSTITGTAATAPVVNISTMDKAEAMQKIMDQAQVLATKGGGEMKVQLNSEGLGNIQLKVAMQDGKVHLQMAAENKEAKSILESSLAELKTSLAAQKLSVENIKVDVVNNTTAADAGMQNQTNLNHQQQQRDQTRQFWNRFNDDFGSQGRKESFTEMTGIKGYGRTERDPLQPIQTSGSATRKVEGKGKGLNLVA